MNTVDDVKRHPRITKAYAKSLIETEKIVVDHELSVVICIVRLKNNHRLVGTALVANHKTFDPDIGTKIARDKVLKQIIQDEMYVLRTKLSAHVQKEVGNAD